VTLEIDPAVAVSARRAVLEIERVFGPNVGRSLLVRVGSRQFQHVLRAGRQQVPLAWEGPRPAQPLRIELEIPCPTSPRELGQGQDTRRLGVGLRRLVIGSGQAR
jgi:hypothetical protein